MRFFAVVLALLLPLALLAQTPVAVSGTEQFTLTSRTNGVEYRVDVWLPPGLDTMTVRPPVFVLTDGNLMFHLAHQTTGGLAISGEVQPLIIVGVSYPETDGRGYTPAYMASRTRDYTPTNLAAMPGGGGGGAFLAFLKDELVPLVESRWRADPTRRGLGGHSLGGLFVTYALLHEPGFFTRYWIGSPSLWWEKPLAFTWVTEAKQAATQPKGRAYLTVGADESDVMIPPMRRMSTELTRNFSGLRVGSHVFVDESHGSVIGAALSRALRFLYGEYGRPSIALSPAARAEYAGTWTAGPQTIRLRPTTTGVTLSLDTFGETVTTELKAAARDTLFGAAGLTTQFVAVRDARGKIIALRGTLLGATQEYTRAGK